MFFSIVSYVIFFFFFFQAEDGIRDLTVTGVQTCALPISLWITLVALSGIPPGEIPRMDAHLAYRVATGMRPGPVRGPLGELARDRRRRLGRALVEAVAHPGTEPGEGVLAALVRAYG